MGDTVHRELDNYGAISEFPRVPQDSPVMYREACFVAGLVPALASFGKAALTGADITRIRSDMIKHGLWGNGGTTMSAGEQYVRGVLGLQTIYPSEWHWHAGTQAEAIHAGLIAQAGINGVVLQVNAAHNLPNNEGGVSSHFVGVGGIDSVLGYKVANGDDKQALAAAGGHGKTYPARWMTWAQIAAAEPTALMAIVHPVKPPTAGTPTGWKDDGATLTAPNGHAVVRGFRAYVLARGNWPADDVPLMDEVGDASQSFQVFARTLLQWAQGSGVQAETAGPIAHLWVSKAA